MNYIFPQSCQINGLNEIYLKHFGYRQTGSFIEVGAFDGYTCSNTWGLAEAGWTGVYFEPIEEYFNNCQNNHSGHTNVACLNLAIGDYNGYITFEMAGILSTASEEQKEILQEVAWAKDAFSGIHRKVPIVKLNNVLESLNYSPEFDVLNIDVEGLEIKVLNGFNIAFWKPKMVIVEAHESHPDIKLRFQAPMINQYFKEAGYEKIYSDQINNIYINPEFFS